MSSEKRPDPFSRLSTHAGISSGPPLRDSHPAPQRGADARHRRVARDRHRRQHRHLQRRQRAAAEAAPVSGSRSAGGALAAIAGHQHPAGLAVARAVHRHPEREPIVRRDVDLAGPQRHVDRRRPRGDCAARRGAADLIEPVPAAGREAASRPAAAAGRGQARASRRS